MIKVSVACLLLAACAVAGCSSGDDAEPRAPISSNTETVTLASGEVHRVDATLDGGDFIRFRVYADERGDYDVVATSGARAAQIQAGSEPFENDDYCSGLDGSQEFVYTCYHDTATMLLRNNEPGSATFEVVDTEGYAAG